MIVARKGHYLPRTGHDHELADVQVAVDVAELDHLVRAAVEDVDHALVAGADLAPEFPDLPPERGVLRRE
jgi:hypothetical protein